MIRVRVDNRIRVPLLDLTRELDEAIRIEFEHENPEHHAKKAIGVPVYNIPRVIKTWTVEGGDLTLPRGGMRRLREALSRGGAQYAAVDERSTGAMPRSFPEYVGHEMRWYQEAAIAAAITREQGIIRMPTGSGKTSMAMALIARLGVPALVVLPTGGLFKQWSDRARVELGLRGRDLGIIRGPKQHLRPVTIAMQQTLWKNDSPAIDGYFGCVIEDEAQLAAARTHQEVINRFRARYRFAISADERRTDRKEFITHDLFGDEVIYEVSRDVLEDDGHVLDVEIRCVPTAFRADWYGVPTDDEPELEVDFARLLGEMTKDEERNELALRFVHAEVSEGEQAIMLTARREHARVLDRYFVEREIPSGYFLGKQDGGDEKEFERTRRGITSGGVRVGIGTYGALGFGIDLPAVSVGCAVTPIAGNAQLTNQVRGRVCRPNPKAGKKSGRLYVMWDRHVYPGHLAKLTAKNKNVTVWDRGSWANAREYNRRMKRA